MRPSYLHHAKSEVELAASSQQPAPLCPNSRQRPLTPQRVVVDNFRVVPAPQLGVVDEGCFTPVISPFWAFSTVLLFRAPPTVCFPVGGLVGRTTLTPYPPTVSVSGDTYSTCLSIRKWPNSASLGRLCEPPLSMCVCLSLDTVLALSFSQRRGTSRALDRSCLRLLCSRAPARRPTSPVTQSPAALESGTQSRDIISGFGGGAHASVQRKRLFSFVTGTFVRWRRSTRCRNPVSKHSYAEYGAQ